VHDNFKHCFQAYASTCKHVVDLIGSGPG